MNISKEHEQMIVELYNNLMEEKKNEIKSFAGNVNMTKSIQVGDYTWSAFSYDEIGNVLFLLDKKYEIITKFGNNNNYLISDARKIANECKSSKQALEIFGEDAFIQTSIDLLTHDGSGTYGTCEGDLFGVMNYDMYRANYANINEKSNMLLSTSESTVSGSGDSYVQFVRSNGDVYYGNANWYGLGVRPFFILKSDILVSLAK